jgi:hypothetical protein
MRGSVTMPKASARFAEIRLRACQRIGQLSTELATAQGSRAELLPSDGKKSKEAQLAEAGISTQHGEPLRGVGRRRLKGAGSRSGGEGIPPAGAGSSFPKREQKEGPFLFFSFL